MKIRQESVRHIDFMRDNPQPACRIGSLPRPQDSFITMGRFERFTQTKNSLFSSLKKIRNWVQTSWEWIYWIIRLCPAEYTRIDTIESIINDPTAAAQDAHDRAPEFMGEIIAATLINPSKVGRMRRENPVQVAQFVNNFKNFCNDTSALFFGKKYTFEAGGHFLNLGNRSMKKNIFANYLLSKPQLAASAMTNYCQTTLSAIGNRSGAELDAIKTALSYFERVAKEGRAHPEAFKKFLEAVFSKSAFDLKDLARLAASNLKSAKFTSSEEKAITVCCQAHYQALHRLNQNPNLLHKGLKDVKNLGRVGIYQAAFKQLGSSEFMELSKILREDYPLGAEVCEQLADIAENRSQFRRVCANLPHAYQAISAIWGDFKNPPDVE